MTRPVARLKLNGPPSLRLRVAAAVLNGLCACVHKLPPRLRRRAAPLVAWITVDLFFRFVPDHEFRALNDAVRAAVEPRP